MKPFPSFSPVSAPRTRVLTFPILLVVLLALPESGFAVDDTARGDRGKTWVVGNPGHRAVLPPVIPWNGRSLDRFVEPGHPWATPFEIAEGRTTPRYEETVAWLRRLADAAPELVLVPLGKSAEGRTVWMVAASAEGAATPEALAANRKPTLLAFAGIHSGEIDGKDAGMILLRELTVDGSRASLLTRANFLFVPILSVDGHERFSPFYRINQRGPEAGGWRTNSRNLNLNRDFSKLDTPEVRALVSALHRYRPDLVLDLHVTDGVDYQYDITWGYTGPHGFLPNAAAWLDTRFTPALNRELRSQDHIPGPLVFAVDETDISRGNNVLSLGPRYSNGYGDVARIPTVLVENHSLKPYRQRVAGTVVLLTASLEVLGAEGETLRKAVREDRRFRPRQIALDWSVDREGAVTTSFLGIESRLEPSAVSGGLRVVWTGRPVSLEIPFFPFTVPWSPVDRPRAYWIPPGWDDVVERLRGHGIQVESLDRERTLSVVRYRVEGAQVEPLPFEGRARVVLSGVTRVAATRTWPAGSVRVPMDQPLGDLAALLLEPLAPDSFFRWGFFLSTLRRTEYAENYVMEPMAREMLAGDPELAREFQEALRDPAFARDPDARLDWFYRRTPFFDREWNLYPVAREE